MTLGTGERERAHKAIVPIVERDECNKPWIMNGSVKENTMFCAGHLVGGIDACKGPIQTLFLRNLKSLDFDI